MKILVINYEFPPVGGGGGVAAYNFTRQFVRLGHEVDYITTHFKGLARQETLDGIRLFREPVWGRKDLNTASIISMLFFPAVAIWRGLKLSRQRKYDLINTHFAIPSGPGGCFLSAWLKLPHILSVHGGDIYDPSKSYSPHKNPLLKWVVKLVLNQATLIVPQSVDTCKRVKRIYGPKTKIHRIPLGFTPPSFNTASRKKLGLNDDTIYGISVSRLIPRKAYPDVLSALYLAGVKNLELLIIGDGPEEPKLRALCAQLDIADRVHFLGYVDDATKFQYLKEADFFVLASLHEGFGIVFQEAMHCGLPIVATNVGGQTDFLKEGRNALLSKPKDSEALGISMAKMATDDKLRQKISEKNLEDIKAHYIENAARQYLEVFNQVLQKRNKRE